MVVLNILECIFRLWNLLYQLVRCHDNPVNCLLEITMLLFLWKEKNGKFSAQGKLWQCREENKQNTIGTNWESNYDHIGGRQVISIACPSSIQGCPLREMTGSGNEYSVKLIPTVSYLHIMDQWRLGTRVSENDKRETWVSKWPVWRVYHTSLLWVDVLMLEQYRGVQ